MSDSAADARSSLLGSCGAHLSLALRAETLSGTAPTRPTPLPDIPSGYPACLTANGATGILRQRLIDLGFTPGTPVRLVRRGPGGNLIAVSIRDTTIALRSEEARSLLVTVI